MAGLRTWPPLPSHSFPSPPSLGDPTRTADLGGWRSVYTFSVAVLGTGRQSRGLISDPTDSSRDFLDLNVVRICAHTHTRARQSSPAGALATGNRFRANTELSGFSAVFDSVFMELNVAVWIEGKKKKTEPKCIQPFC